MSIQTVPMVKEDGLLFYLFLLTSFFFLVEISFFIQSNKAYLADFSFVSNQLSIPLSILPGILFFIVAQLAIHIAYCIFVWLVAIFTGYIMRLSSRKIFYLGIFLWIVGIVTVLITNLYYYPNSRFSILISGVFSNFAVKLLLFSLLAMNGLFILFASIGLLLFIILSFYQFGNLLKGMISLFSILLICSLVFLNYQPVVKPSAPQSRPNIFIIGMDSLRPDFLSFFGGVSTPFLDSILSQSTVFSEALTPLARTFPSWVSLLSGEYPKEIGIRFNLASQSKIHFSQSLPRLLQQQGYETVYATDEVRFSNISQSLGFDQLITPPMGLNDFLIGTFNDFPLSNLLINTSLGKWLFPYSYGNRPVYFTYEPNSFLNLIHPILKQPREKPLFLAIHFCLTHYPYLWAKLTDKSYSILQQYEESVRGIDKQVSDFFSLLKAYHLLDHAIVVLLSDHGEALELTGDRITEKDLFRSERKQTIPQFYPQSLDKEAINQSAGHGTDVLSISQYHSLLAFKFYGEKQEAKVIPTIVSLLDIKPTLLAFLHLPISASSGQSLLPIIEGTHVIHPHPIFLESDFTPEAIRTVYPETRKVVLEGIQLFQIDPLSTRLTVKNSMGEMIVKSKQYADIDGEWVLALYPQSKETYMPILVNLKSGEWTNDLKSPLAKKSPAKTLLSALKKFYGNEITRIN